MFRNWVIYLYFLLPAPLPPPVQETVQITARAHDQTLGDPPHRHRRLRPRARRQRHLHWIPLGPSFAISFLPPPPVLLLRDDPFASVTAIHDVIHRARILDSQPAGHGWRVASAVSRIIIKN